MICQFCRVLLEQYHSVVETWKGMVQAEGFTKFSKSVDTGARVGAQRDDCKARVSHLSGEMRPMKMGRKAVPVIQAWGSLLLSSCAKITGLTGTAHCCSVGLDFCSFLSLTVVTEV